MALTDILEKIKQETAAKTAELEKAFGEKKKKLEADFANRQRKIDEDTHNKVEENSKKIIKKAESLAEMEAKNILLREKHRLIEETLDKAMEKLVASHDYVEIITELLKKSDISGSEEIVIVPAKGKEKETKEAIQKAGKTFFLSEKAADIAGGFILKTPKVEVDNSFATIIKGQMKEELEIRINNILFA